MAIITNESTTNFVLDISDFKFFSILTTKAIEEVFIKVGKLDKGCFNISREYFSDGSYKINFYYPTDMTKEDANQFFNLLITSLKTMTLVDFNNLIIN